MSASFAADDSWVPQLCSATSALDSLAAKPCAGKARSGGFASGTAAPPGCVAPCLRGLGALAKAATSSGGGALSAAAAAAVAEALERAPGLHRAISAAGARHSGLRWLSSCGYAARLPLSGQSGARAAVTA